MAKDPAFLFYPNDWLGGTLGMTFEEKGAYMEVLMLQFNRGHMEGHMIGQVIGQIWDKIKHKFEVDENGLYYNERLQIEVDKRKAFTTSRKNNLLGKNQYSKKNKKQTHMTSHMDGHMTSHMENENVNEDIDILNNKISKKELKIIEPTIFDDFLNANCPSVRKLKIQMTPEQAEKLATEFGMQACHEIFEAMENWQPLTKKSKSVFLTAKTWLNKRKQTATTNGKQKLTFTEAAMDWLNRTS